MTLIDLVPPIFGGVAFALSMGMCIVGRDAMLLGAVIDPKRDRSP